MSDLAISVGFAGINAAQSQFNRFTATTTAGIGRINTSTNALSSSVAGISSALPGVGGAFAALVNPITLVAGAVTGLGVAFANAVGTARNFEKQIANTAAIVTTGLGADEAARQIAALTEEAKLLGSSTEFSASQAASAMEFLGRAGFSTREILAATGDTLSLATVGNLDLAKAADIATNVLSQFRLEADELGSVVDVISKATTSANTNVTQFADAMNYLGPTAAALGVSLEEASAAIGVLSNNGLQGSLGTRALGTSLTRLAAPTKRMQGLIQQLGLNFFDASGEFVGLSGTIAQLEGVLSGATDEQQQYVLSTLFGQEAIQEWNILLSNGSKALSDYTGEIEAAGLQQGEFAQGIRDTKLDTLEGAIISIRSAWEGFQIAIAEGALPGLKDFGFAIADTIRGITNFVSTIKQTESLGSVFGPIGGALDRLFQSMDNIRRNFTDIFNGLFGEAGGEVKSFGEILLDVAEGAIVVFIEAQSLAYKSIEFFSGVFSKYLVPAIRPAIDIFRVFVATISNLPAIASGAFAAINQVTANFVSGVVDQFTGVGDILQGIFSLDLTQIQEGLRTVRDGVVSTSIGIGRGAAAAYTEAYNASIAESSQSTVDSISGALDSAVEASRVVGENAGNGLGAGLSNGLEKGLNAAVGSLAFLEEKLKAVNEAIQSLPPDSPALAQLALRAVELEGQIEKVEARIKLLRLGIESLPELKTIQIAIDMPDLTSESFNIPEFAASIDTTSFENLSTAFENIGLSSQFIQQNMQNIPALTEAVGSSAFSLAESFGASADNAAQFALNINEALTSTIPFAVNSLGSAFERLGRDIGEAFINGEKFAGRFVQTIAAVVGEIISQATKVLGMALLQAATTIPFPASLPFIVGGAALLGLSGLVSGLTKSSRSFQPGSASIDPNALSSNNTQSSTNLTGLSGLSGEEGGQTIIYLTNNIETDGIITQLNEQQIIAGELTNGRG